MRSTWGQRVRGLCAASIVAALCGGCALTHAVRPDSAVALDGVVPDGFDVVGDGPLDVVGDVPQEACGPGTIACGGRCASPTDVRTCGAGCVNCTALPGVDPGSATCDGARCVLTGACAAGRADCDGNPANGCEADVTTAAHCGGCTTTCAAPTPVCAMSPGTPPTYRCMGACPLPSMMCGESCVDVASDVNHCGGCGTVCARANATLRCVGGSCQYTCVAGFHECAGACVPNDSTAACGPGCLVCTGVANGRATCSGGACGLACDPGFNLCRGTCWPADSTAACGTACATCTTTVPFAMPVCTGGACDFACVTGYMRMGGACVRTPVCGNRVLETGETCDDGNTTSRDGCSSSCMIEGLATDDCPGQPIAVAMGGAQLYVASTAIPGLSNRNMGCGAGGPERIFAFTFVSGGTLTVRVSPMPGSSFDVLLRHGSGCPPGNGSCTDVMGAGSPETISATVSGGATYYVTVDGMAGSSGTFVLSVDLR